jgi:hypothetical protein
MKIIGISGKKRSGKDEACSAILAAYPGLGRRMAFADPLKAEVAAACGVSVETLERHKQHFRTILQGWGTEFRRQFSGNNNYWIDRLTDELECLEAIGGKLAVITDVRFPNEFQLVKDRGGIVLRIESLRCNNNDSHPSETALDDHLFDITIRNDGTLDEFRSAVIEAVSPFITSAQLAVA